MDLQSPTDELWLYITKSFREFSICNSTGEFLLKIEDKSYYEVLRLARLRANRNNSNYIIVAQYDGIQYKIDIAYPTNWAT